MEAVTGIVIVALLTLIPIQGMIWLGLKQENDRKFKLLVYAQARRLQFKKRRR